MSTAPAPAALFTVADLTPPQTPVPGAHARGRDPAASDAALAGDGYVWLAELPAPQAPPCSTCGQLMRLPAGEWQDGETWFVRCSAWGDAAENIAASLSRGLAVVATGRLRCRTWEDKDGGKRAAVEMTVDDIGPSLRRAVAKVTKATREHAPATGTGAASDPWSTPEPDPAAAAGFSDEPPF